MAKSNGAASHAELGALHKRTAQVMNRALQFTEDAMEPLVGEDEEGNEVILRQAKEPNASLLSVITSFLKNNDITAQVDAEDEMGELDRRLDGLSSKRRRTKPDLNVVPMTVNE